MTTTASRKNESHDTNNLHEEIARMRLQVAALEKRLARGTDDVAEAAAAASRATLAERVEAALRAAPHGMEALCREVRAPAGPVSAIVRRLRAAKHVANVGTEHEPAWFWVVTDEATPDELGAAIAALIRFRPMTHHELLIFTGARRGRVSGHLVELERAEVEGFAKVGDPRRWHYSLPPR